MLGRKRAIIACHPTIRHLVQPEDMNPQEQDTIGRIPIAGEPGSGQPVEQAEPDGPDGPDPATAPHQPRPAWPTRRRQRQKLEAVLFQVGLSAALALILYLLGTLIIFPLTAPRLMAQALEQRLERPVTIARAEWRPLATRLILHNGIIGPQQSDPYDRVDPLLSFRTMELDFGFFTLLRRGTLLSSAVVEQGYAHLVREESGEYNLPLTPLLSSSRLLPKRIEISHSRLEYTDRTQAVIFNDRLTSLNGTAQRGGEREGRLRFSFGGQGPATSRLELDGDYHPAGPAWQAKLTLADLPLTALNSYLAPRLQSELAGGRLDGSAELQRAAGKIRLEQQLILSELLLPEAATEQQPALPLLQALLTDQHRRLSLHWQTESAREDREATYLEQLSAKLNRLLTAADQDPWELLARQFPEQEITERIDFGAGSSSLSRQGGRMLDQLATILAQRPLLTLQLEGISDPACDRPALAKQKEQELRRQRRQAVAALARQLAGEEQPETPAPSPETGLRPAAVTVSDAELLELATQRQQNVAQRLEIALGEEQTGRFSKSAPTLTPTTHQANTCGAAVRLHLKHRPVNNK